MSVPFARQFHRCGHYISIGLIFLWPFQDSGEQLAKNTTFGQLLWIYVISLNRVKVPEIFSICAIHMNKIRRLYTFADHFVHRNLLYFQLSYR